MHACAIVVNDAGHACMLNVRIWVTAENHLVLSVPANLQDQTLAEISDFLAWCGQILLSGKFPECGYYGEEFKVGTTFAKNRGKSIAGKYRFAFSAQLSDNKQRALTHRFQVRNWQSNFICEECFASRKLEFAEFHCYDHSKHARCGLNYIRDTLFFRKTPKRHRKDS